MYTYRNARQCLDILSTGQRPPHPGNLFKCILWLIAVVSLVSGSPLASAGVIVAAALRAIAGDPSDEGWKLVRERDGVRVFIKRDAGTTYPTGMARADVEAPCRYVYQRLRFPGPVSDRTYVIRVDDDLSRASDGRYRVTWRLADSEGGTETDGGVRRRDLSGSWSLTPAGNAGKCTGVYVVHMDPGGWIPQWLTGFAIRHYLPEVFAAVRDRAQQTRPAATAGVCSCRGKHGAGPIAPPTAATRS